MENTGPAQESIKLSVEKIIDRVRQLRNDLIKEFLVDQNLQAYFLQQYKKELSPVKIEFCKKDLKELLISPVDLTHYSSLIKKIKESSSVDSMDDDMTLFYKDLNTIFKKYNF